MLRNLIAKWINLRRMSQTTYRNTPHNPRRYSERRRRSGDGRQRDIFEERGAASEDEYVRKETARQLKELKKQLEQRKAEKKNKLAEKDKMEKENNEKQDADKSSNPNKE
ncbi:uncharacterized protein LOC113561910 [Ooceraea biroi]|uniref:uncharacterized protein LOC113561910 n=1 Tax=Ooceraea biroi TaxID=2015173 RepID=UPI000F07CEB0|nr:uncharacterized protein LOC113561910 [Ooceraea biroi]